MVKRYEKGRRAEYELRDKLRSYGFYNVRRGSVLHGTQDVFNLLGIHIEVKMHAKIDISTWLSQSIASAEKRQDGLPVIMYRQADKTHRGLPWLVTMRLEDWWRIGGADFFAVTRSVGIYERMKRASEAGQKAVIDHLSVGSVVSMYLDDWIELYGNWKLPFTEDDDVPSGD